MKWSEPVLVQYEAKRASSKRKIIARLGIPRPCEDEDLWACFFQLQGGKYNRIQVGHGVDGLQALLIAAQALRRALDRIKLSGSNFEPHEFVFPRLVPTAYGLDVHHRLCRIVDDEIGEQEKELTKRRLARRRRTRPGSS
jgi:hypothetical protein